MIDIELDLPVHVEELKKVDEYISELKKKITTVRLSQKMNVREFSKLNNKIINTLYYVGELSEPAFAAEHKIENTYFNIHENQPELARHEWQKHYETIHRPYNKYKNRLYRMLDDLDDIYFKINKTFPPDSIK